MVNEQKHAELAKLADDISRCGRCGFCQSVCPVYQVTAHEEGVARGRNMYARELLAGDLQMDRENEAFLTECLLCRACVEMCFSSVKTDEIVLAMRRESMRAGGKSGLNQYIFNHLLHDHRRLGLAIRFASVGRTAGALKLAQALDIFGWYGCRFRRLDDFLSAIPKESLRERLARGMHGGSSSSATRRPSEVGSEKHTKAFLFIGCGTNFMFPHVGETGATVLKEFGYEVAVSDNCCCGLPAHAHGAFDAARNLAEKNLKILGDPDTLIITDCSSCASFLKSYPALISATGGNQSLIEEAEKFAGRVRDMTEILRDSALGLSVVKNRPGETGRVRVTFHDPCHLNRHQKLSVQAREVLRSLSHIEFVEMKEADWCCGGAGAFALEHPDLSLEVARRKVGNIAKARVDIVATTCPSCMMQLQSGLRQSVDLADRRIRVRHLVELVRGPL